MSSTEKRHKESEEAFAGVPLKDDHHHRPKEHFAATSAATTADAPGTAKDQDENESSPASVEDAGRQKTDKVLETKYLLIGAGTASYAAMKAIQEKDPGASVIVVGLESYPPYQRPPLSKELWFNDDAKSRQDLQFTNWQGETSNVFYDLKDTPENVTLMLGTEATHIDTNVRVVTLNNNARIRYEKALIATGGTPRAMSIMQDKDRMARLNGNVTTYRSVADFKSLDRLTDDIQSVAIIGGGFLGSELACALARKASTRPLKVIQIYPEDGNMSSVFPRYLSKWTATRLEKEGVKILPNTNVVGMEPSEPDQDVSLPNKVTISLDNGTTLKVDHVVVATGIIPNDALASHSGLATDAVQGGIVVNQFLEASPGVFAAGDVSCYYDGLLCTRRRMEHHDHAMSSGRYAGLNMSSGQDSENVPYDYQPMFWSDLGPEVSYEAVGQTENSLDTIGIWAKSKTAPEDAEGPIYNKGLVFYLKSDTIVGLLMFNLLNRVELARKILALKKTAADIQDIVQQFKVNE